MGAGFAGVYFLRESTSVLGDDHSQSIYDNRIWYK